MKRGKPLSRKTPLRAKKGLSQRRPEPIPYKKGKSLKRTKLQAVSKKRREEGKTYSELRKEFLTAHPFCHPCQDDERFRTKATQVHHKAGRGKFYLRVDTWLPVCGQCHADITDSREWAESMGYSYTVAQRREL